MLKVDCKVPVREISKKIGIPITTIYSKIKRMENLGVIKGYKAIVEGKKIGINVSAFICISTSSEGVKDGGKKPLEEKVAEELSGIKEVEEIFIVTGPWDIIVKVKAEDVQSVGNMILRKIRRIKGIKDTLTLVSIKDVKTVC